MRPSNGPFGLHAPELGGAFFQSLVENAPLGIFVQMRGCFTYLNPAACDILGVESQEFLVGTKVLERFRPEDRARIAERIRRLNENREKVEVSEQEFLRLDGSTGVGQTSAIPFEHEGEHGALVFIRDFTQHRRDREAVELRDELLRSTGRMAKVGGWEFDATTLQGTWTEEVARIHELDPNEPTNVQLGLSFYTPPSRRLVETAIAKAISDGESYELELEMVTPSGSRKWVRTKGVPEWRHGRVARVRGIFQDITEARMAAQLVAERTERLEVTLRSIGDGVITTDAEGLVTLLNPVAEELTGWRSEDAQGRNLGEVFVIFNEHTKAICEDPVAKVLKTGLVVELANHTCLKSKTGVERSIADSGAPIKDWDGNIIGVVLVFRDMTEKHKLTESMHRAQSLESIGVLAGGIAHDFNNLLSGIFGNLNIALEASTRSDQATVQSSIAKALGIFDRAKALTQQLLTFSKGGTPVRQVQELGGLLRRCTSFALSGSNVSANLDIDPDLWKCECDPNQLGQAIDNLVINAQQAMPHGGVVDVRACNIVLDPNPARPPNRSGPFVRVGIADHGTGIPAGILARIFDPFFSTKATGHGLGLATVHSIVKRHDGWIEVESKEGIGTKFDIFLPAHSDSTAVEPSSIEPPKSASMAGGRILVMDDEEFIAEYLETMLKMHGYDVVAVANGEDAVDSFRRSEASGIPFDLCILDLTVPGGMGGVAAAQAIHALRANVPLVASSGYAEDPVVADPGSHGFVDSLSKPFLKADLLEMLERVFRS